MPTIFIHEGANGDGTIGTPYNVAWFNSNAAGGNTYYFLDTITTAVQFNDGGTAVAPLIVRGDWPGRECTFDGQQTTNIGLYLICPDGGTDLEYVTFLNFTVRDYQNRAIGVLGPVDKLAYIQHITIDGIRTIDIGEVGDSGDADISFSRNARQCIVRNCVLRGNGSTRGVDGIVFGGTSTADGCNGSGFRIYNNDISGHEENAIDFKFHTESAASEGYSEVWGNRLGAGYGASYAALDVHYGSEKVKAWGNLLYDARVGIRLIEETAEAITVEDVHIYGNVFSDITTYGIIGDVTNHVTGPVYVYNNTFDGGITVASGCCIRAEGKAAGAAWTIKNNIFNGSCPLTSNYQLRIDDVAVTNGTTADYNLYGALNPSGDLAHWDLAGKTLAEMRTASQEANGAYSVVAFDSAYKPTTTNAQGTGTWIAGVRAYDDLPLPLRPDLGAVQDRNAAGRKFGVGGGAL